MRCHAAAVVTLFVCLCASEQEEEFKSSPQKTQIQNDPPAVAPADVTLKKKKKKKSFPGFVLVSPRVSSPARRRDVDARNLLRIAGVMITIIDQ